MNGSSILNLILWSPIVGALALLIIPSLLSFAGVLEKGSESEDRIVRWMALISTVFTGVFSACLYFAFDQSKSGLQMIFEMHWIKDYNIFYRLGIDGLSLPMILLTSLLFCICMMSSWTITKKVKGYFALLLMLQSTVYGVFMSLDFFLFYV